MAVKLWRCYNEECDQKGTAFESERQNCPCCKMLQVIELTPVHYFVPAEGPIRTALGNRMIACDQNMKTMPHSASGDRKAVTCPKCLATVMFAEDERDNINNHVPFFEGVIPQNVQ